MQSSPPEVSGSSSDSATVPSEPTAIRSVRQPFHHSILSLLDSWDRLLCRIPGIQQLGDGRWFALAMLASFGLHTFLVLIPTSREAPPPTPTTEKPKDQVRITQLPTVARKPIAKPITRVAPARRALPTVRRASANPLAIPPRSQPSQRTETSPPPASTPPIAPPQTASNASTGSTDQTPLGDNLWQDFPLYPGSQPGCFGLDSCLQVSAGIRQVVVHFEKELPAKKYAIQRSEQASERTVYQVSRNGQTQFLSILSSEGKTVYVLSDAPRTLDDLKKAIEVPPEVQAILTGLAVQQAEPSFFAEPSLFYTPADAKSLTPGALVPKPEIRNISLVAGQPSETMMDEFFRTNLQTNDFEITDLPQEYGGGKLHQIQKEGVTLYINLVPTKDKSGSLIVIWRKSPA